LLCVCHAGGQFCENAPRVVQYRREGEQRKKKINEQDSTSRTEAGLISILLVPLDLGATRMVGALSTTADENKATHKTTCNDDEGIVV
jgi:hypothetical protein